MLWVRFRLLAAGAWVLAADRGLHQLGTPPTLAASNGGHRRAGPEAEHLDVLT